MPPGRKPQPGRIEPTSAAGKPKAQDLVRAKKTTPAKLLERDKWGKQERWQEEFETTGGKVAISTEVGRVRLNNQDSIGAVEKDGVALFVVCDGVGGASFGEIASGLTTSRAIQAFEDSDDPNNFNLQSNIRDTEAAFEEAGKLGSIDQIEDGATTFTAVRVEGNKMKVDTLADSGVMVIRQGQIIFITRPEHAAQRYYEREKCSPEEAVKKTRNVILQDIGDPTKKIDSAILNHSEFNLKPGDKVIMYSDGLTDPYFKIVPVDADGNNDYAEFNAISGVQRLIIESQTSRDPGEINRALTEMSLDDGSQDNVSIITYIHEGVTEVQVEDTDFGEEDAPTVMATAPEAAPEAVTPISPEYNLAEQEDTFEIIKAFDREFGLSRISLMFLKVDDQPAINQQELNGVVALAREIKYEIPDDISIEFSSFSREPDINTSIRLIQFPISSSREVVLEAITKAQEEHWGTPEIVNQAAHRLIAEIATRVEGQELDHEDLWDLEFLLMKDLQFDDPKLTFQIRLALRKALKQATN